MIKSICIVRLSALGDVLMLVPLVRTLQKGLPGVAITWVISRPAYDLVEGMDGVDFVVIDKPSSLGDYWVFKKRMQARQFDVLLAAQASFRANLLYPLIKAKRKIGFDKLRAKDGHGWFIKERIQPGDDHTLESFLKFARVLGIEQPFIEWNLPVSQADYDWAKMQVSEQRPLVVINPAASKPERSWLVDRYVAVMKDLQTRWQAQLVLTGGPGSYDRDLANQILQEVPEALDLVGKTRPKQLLALIGLADLVICPDTGPSHMAAAMATPVIALHAVTSSQVSGPYLYRHFAVDYYPAAVETVLKLSPEANVWGTHAHGEETMALVPVEAVLSRVAEVLPSTISS